MKRRLLILSCSESKNCSLGLLRAVDRYKHPIFGVLRCFLRECPYEADLLDVYILSAEHGLISGNSPIKYYDRKMDEGRAVELLPQVNKIILGIQLNEYASICSVLSDAYHLALPENWVPSNVAYKKIKRRRGREQTELKEWLRTFKSSST